MLLRNIWNTKSGDPEICDKTPPHIAYCKQTKTSNFRENPRNLENKVAINSTIRTHLYLHLQEKLIQLRKMTQQNASCSVLIRNHLPTLLVPHNNLDSVTSHRLLSL